MKKSPACSNLVVDDFRKALCDTARTGLVRLYSNDTLPYTVRDKGNREYTLEGFSVRYAAISQIGIMRWLRYHPNEKPYLPDLWPRILAQVNDVNHVGDFALLLWAAAESGRDDCDKFAKMVVQRWPDSHQMCNAVELGWIVQSLVRLSEIVDLGADARAVLNAAHDKMLSLFNPISRLFARHDRTGLTEMLSRRVACFADQVYPMLALANYGRCFNDSRSTDIAVAAADTISRLQGPEGQWWWHYDVKAGKVAEEYPVFSVHQHGMAPMALLAVDEAAGTDHTKYIEAGLIWLTGRNELDLTMIQQEQGVVWRDIHRREVGKIFRFVRGGLSLAGWDWLNRRLGRRWFGYIINRECRPYELGWLLYAWAAQPLGPASRFTPATNLNDTIVTSQQSTMKAAEGLVSEKRTGRVCILGVSINKMTMTEVLSAADEHITSRQRLLLGVVNVAKLVKSRKDSRLRQSIEQADLVLADGAPIVWLSRALGMALPERVAGIDIMVELLKAADKKHWRVYFLGARPEVLSLLVENVKKDFPGVQIAGYRDGYFTEAQEEDVATTIKSSNADILFVGISPPKKEIFLGRWSQYTNVPVCHGVGGSFDVLAGVIKRAPLWMQKRGLEWFYRVVQEPRRMWKRYLTTNIVFVGLSLKAIIKIRVGRLISGSASTSASDSMNRDKQ
jgi:exopolysaccharide biosynthesis WecB/TagA/CpsF family protein